MRRKKETTSTMDAYIGNKLRLSRKKHRMTQESLSNLVGVSHQQIQQYEKGKNRIAASTLYNIAKILKVPINYFYDGIEESLQQDTSTVYSSGTISERLLPLNVLMVESNAADEVFMRRLLENHEKRNRLHVVRDGVEALKFLRNAEGINSFPRPDIVLLALNLPKQDGLSVLKTIKRDRNLLDIPVIILTNSVNAHDMHTAYNSYANGFLNKTFEDKKFQEIFNTMISYWNAIVLPSMSHD